MASTQNPTREQALALMHEYVQSESLRRHMYAVEAAMRAYATKYNEDPELWGIAGLLHDFDYEKYPNHDLHPDKEHPAEGVKILREQGYPEEVLEAILGHAHYTNVPRTSNVAKALFACDELCGFIVACAHIRPEKLNNMDAVSVNKKLKKADFAAKVSRADIDQGISELGVTRDEHINFVIAALQPKAAELGF